MVKKALSDSGAGLLVPDRQSESVVVPGDDQGAGLLERHTDQRTARAPWAGALPLFSYSRKAPHGGRS